MDRDHATDPLMLYRVGKLEEAVTSLSDALHEIRDTVRSGKLLVAALFGIVQPVVLAVVVHWLTR
jgi:hypothetical protein